LNKIFILTKNEISKALANRIIIGFTILSFVVVFVFGLYIKNSPAKFSERKLENWKNFLQIEIETNNSFLNDPSIGFSSSDIINEMINQNKVYQFQIDNNIPPILDKSASSLILRVNELFIFITICVIMLSCYLISSEYTNGTMSRLVIINAKRWKILLSKFLSIIILTTLFIFIFMICSILCGWALFGFDNFSVQCVYYNGKEIVQRNVLSQLFLCLAYNCVSLYAISSLAVSIAVLTRSNLLGISLCFCISAFGSVLSSAFPDSSFLKYTLFSNTNYSQYLTNSIGNGEITPTVSLIILLIHIFVFTILSFILFNKRDIEC